MKYSSKIEFVKDVRKEKLSLDGMLSKLSDEQMCLPGVAGYDMDWSIKDIIAHLYEWHQMAMLWFRDGNEGNEPSMPAPGYKWNQLRALNTEIFLKYRDCPLDEVRSSFNSSYKELLGLIESLPEQKLMEAGHFGWTKKNALITYFGANTASHYRWAMQRIKAWMRKLKFS